MVELFAMDIFSPYAVTCLMQRIFKEFIAYETS